MPGAFTRLAEKDRWRSSHRSGDDSIEWNAILGPLQQCGLVVSLRWCQMVAASPAKRVRGKRPPEGEPVVDRAFSLLAAFDAAHRRLTLRELSRRSGIPVSST
ncbi:MAG: helix-turn-helix domain-containing protein, partial [Trebonia sp.]